MNKLNFRYKCWRAKISLYVDWSLESTTSGLCHYINKNIGAEAAEWFDGEFRAESHYPKKAFWLGPHVANEYSYLRRHEYLRKFRDKAILTGEYKKW